MESMLRRLRLIKVESRESDARRRLQKELFEFNESCDRDFPSRPSCLAYDAHLSLLALGTRTGAIRIYGRPGVYFCGQHKAEVEVKKMCFLPEQARLITLCSDNSLNLWEYNPKLEKQTALELVKSCSVENSKLITSWNLSTNHEQLALGTESGNVHFFDIKTFTLAEKVLYQDVLTKNAPEDFKVSPGAIEAVLYHPSDSNKILIGYNRGLVVSWSLSDDLAESTCNSSQQLESLAFTKDGKEFVSAHADGSYVTWSIVDITKPKDHPSTPYGPFPCKAITAVECHAGKSEPWTVFVGGMPRASHGDKHTVSVIHGSKHVVFDFTSRVLDFSVLAASAEDASGVNEPHTLLVLTEEQLVAIDLTVDGWPLHRLPYLSSTAAMSDVTTIHHIDGLSQAALNNIVNAGHRQFSAYSSNEWPITGGELKEVSDKRATSILLTGHLDGSVRFWDVSLSGGLYLLYTLHTSELFAVDTLNAQPTGEPSEDEWPPLRKVGGKQFTLDDQHLSISKIVFCTQSDTLLLGGASGQISVFSLTGADGEHKVEKHIMSLCETTICYSTEALELKPEPVMSPGFQAVCVVQMHPPAACKHLAYHSSGKLIAAASDQGVGVFDLVRLKTVCTKPVTASSELKMSRSRSFQRTLRDSFRQLRRHRSEADNKPEPKSATETQQPPAEGSSEPAENTEKPAETTEVTESKKPETEAENKEEKNNETIEKTDEKTEKIATEDEVKKDVEHIEVKDEEKKTDSEIIATSDEAPKTEELKKENEQSPPKSPTKAKSATLGRDHTAPTPVVMEAVNSISFADTFIAQGQSQGVTLWIGTVAGHVLIYQLVVPEADQRTEADVKCMIAKEIHLKHGAPVIATFVVDRNSRLVTDAVKLEPESPGAHTGHRVVVCTEQQVKIFSLPSLKAHKKYKLSAHGDGDSQFVDAKFCTFISKSDDAYSEPDLVCVTNRGKIHILSIPPLHLQLQPNKGFATGASVAIATDMTQRGRVVYKLSTSPELREFSASAHPTAPLCVIQLKEGMRPEPEPEPVVEAAPEAVAELAVPDEPAKDPEGNKTDAPVEAQPTDKGDVKPADESVVSVNDSLVAGDITCDSIKVHVKEESFAESEISSQKVVETMTHSIKTVSGVTEELKTTTIESVSKIEGMMSSCSMTSSTSTSSKVEESMAVTSGTTTASAAVEG